MRNELKNYRVATASFALNYYQTESAAREYVEQLNDHSPSFAAECSVERRGYRDPAEWNEVLTVSQQFDKACDRARVNGIDCFRFDGVTFRYSRVTGQYHAAKN